MPPGTPMRSATTTGSRTRPAGASGCSAPGCPATRRRAGLSTAFLPDPPMPELPPKAFEKLSRTIGDGGGLRFGSKERRKASGDSRDLFAPSAALDYAELQVTSNFSFLRGASHPWELVERAAALGLAAIAVTDRNSVAGLVRAHQAAEEAGIRLVVGARLDLMDGTSLLAFPED